MVAKRFIGLAVKVSRPTTSTSKLETSSGFQAPQRREGSPVSNEYGPGGDWCRRRKGILARNPRSGLRSWPLPTTLRSI